MARPSGLVIFVIFCVGCNGVVGMPRPPPPLEEEGAWGQQSPLTLRGNGYEGLTVAISSQVPHQDCNNVLHGIKVSHYYYIIN